MRIGLHTWGSEGDIRPVLTLATALADRGHHVRLEVVGAPQADYGAVAARHGVELRARPVPGLDAPEAMDRLADAWLASRSPFRQAEMILSSAVDPAVDMMTETARDLCATSDLVVNHFFVHPLRTLGEKTGVPLVTLHLAHTGCPSAFIAPPGFPAIGRLGNRLAWSLVRSGINRLFLARINRVRLQEGLAPVTDVMSQAWTVPRALHAVVFPHCAAVVHHGGAGTAHAAVRAGLPSVVVPHVADQFFWSRELTRVGAACAVVPRRRLDAGRLAAALRRTLSTPSCAARARTLRPLLAGEDGTTRAVELIERLVRGQWPQQEVAV